MASGPRKPLWENSLMCEQQSSPGRDPTSYGEGMIQTSSTDRPLGQPSVAAHAVPLAAAAAAAAKSLQSCLTLCDPKEGSPPGSSVPGILQARLLKWVVISFSNACMHAGPWLELL